MECEQGYKIVFSADLHGNSGQYKKLVKYCISTGVKCLIIGGDIITKCQDLGSYEALQQSQRLWLQTEFKKLIKPLSEKNILCFLLMGNGDCKANIDVMMEHQQEGLYTIIHDKRIELNTGKDKFYLVGYSYIPFTWSAMKDWEKI